MYPYTDYFVFSEGVPDRVRVFIKTTDINFFFWHINTSNLRLDNGFASCQAL